jgi:flavin-dependent amine oxidoreductase
MEELGWHGPATTLSGFVEPFDTWADMRHLLPHERWPQPPRALAYFCSVLPDLEAWGDRSGREYLSTQRDRVRQDAIRFLNRDIVHLWPNAVQTPGEFRWDLLADPTESEGARAHRQGEARFASQYWTANVSPSDRYALSLPGSSTYRISPLDGTYDNLTVAGDWTACGFNAGCVEAAIMSGRLAAHAISRSPALEDIVGFDHP